VPSWCGYKSNLWGYQVHNALVIGGGVIPGATSIGTTRVRWGWRNNQDGAIGNFGSDDVYTGIGTKIYSAGNSYYTACSSLNTCYVVYPDHPGGRALSFALLGRGAAITPPASPPSLAAYYVDVGGTALGVQCDTAAANGGGWLLVLNYVHLGGGSPSLKIRNLAACPPFISSQTLGSDEQTTTGCGGSWGQLDQATLAQVRALPAPAAAAAARASLASATRASYCYPLHWSWRGTCSPVAVTLIP
jgi:hypothetical protein